MKRITCHLRTALLLSISAIALISFTSVLIHIPLVCANDGTWYPNTGDFTDSFEANNLTANWNSTTGNFPSRSTGQTHNGSYSANFNDASHYDTQLKQWIGEDIDGVTTDVWAYFLSFTGSLETIFGIASEGYTHGTIFLIRNNTDSYLWVYWLDSTQCWTCQSTGYTVPTGSWVHYLVEADLSTHDPTTGHIKLYVNSALQWETTDGSGSGKGFWYSPSYQNFKSILVGWMDLGWTSLPHNSPWPTLNQHLYIDDVALNLSIAYHYLIMNSCNHGTTQPTSPSGPTAYPTTDAVLLNAAADTYYTFDYWHIDSSDDYDNPHSLLMSENHTVTAVFIHSYHDVAVMEVGLSKTVVGQGYSMSIDVMVANLGNYTEAFDVTIFANATAIGTETVNDMANGTSLPLHFAWNTSSFANGNYLINSYAAPVQGEANTTDNTLDSEWVSVAMLGDVNADGEVDILDAATIGLHFSHLPPDGHAQGTPQYSSCFNADINDDGIVDIFDIVVVALHFGETS